MSTFDDNEFWICSNIDTVVIRTGYAERIHWQRYYEQIPNHMKLLGTHLMLPVDDDHPDEIALHIGGKCYDDGSGGFIVLEHDVSDLEANVCLYYAPRFIHCRYQSAAIFQFRHGLVSIIDAVHDVLRMFRSSSFYCTCTIDDIITISMIHDHILVLEMKVSGNE